MSPHNSTHTRLPSNSREDWTQMLLTNTPQPRFAPVVTAGRIQQLTEENRSEVLAFLATRPRYTFVMTGWILDNGLVSHLNRGTFYGHRNTAGQLDGVALIGHVTLFETSNEAALTAFALLTRDCPTAKTVMGEADKVDRFL